MTIALDEEWDTHISAALFAYRTLQNNTTRHEPFFLTYGREARLPIELQFETTLTTEIDIEEQLLKRIFNLINYLPEYVNKAKHNINLTQERSKERYDRRLRKIESFEIGDKVLIYNMKRHAEHGNKFKSQWKEEWYYIHETYQNGAYKLRNRQGQLLKKTFNGVQLKLYHERQNLFEPEVVIEYVDPPTILN